MTWIILVCGREVRPDYKWADLIILEEVVTEVEKFLKKAEELRRRVLRTGMKKRLQKFGILRKLVARISSSEWGLRVLRHNKTIRNIAEFVRGKF